MTPLPDAYLRHGPEGCGDEELLSLLAGSRRLGAALLTHFGSLAAVAQASPGALRVVLSRARAARVHAAFAAARRAFMGAPPRGLVLGPADAAAWLVPRLTGLGHEELHALFVDTRGRVLAVSRMSQGSVDHTVFDVRTILGEALRVGARGVVLGHNHPSGELEPSAEDLLVTRRIEEGAMLVGVQVQDHLVVAHGRWTSMAERGELGRADGPRRFGAGRATVS